MATRVATFSAAADAEEFCGKRKTPTCKEMSTAASESLTRATLACDVPNAGRPRMRAFTASATLLVMRSRSVALAWNAAADGPGEPAELEFLLRMREISNAAVTDAFCADRRG